MRAILINPENMSVTEVDTDGSLESLQEFVGGYIEAVRLGDGIDMYVNEEGMIHANILAKGAFCLRGASQPYVGCGIIVGCSAGGKVTDLFSGVTVELVQSKIWEWLAGEDE